MGGQDDSHSESQDDGGEHSERSAPIAKKGVKKKLKKPALLYFSDPHHLYYFSFRLENYSDGHLSVDHLTSSKDLPR